MDPTELDMEDVLDETENTSGDTYIVSPDPGPTTIEPDVVWVDPKYEPKSRPSLKSYLETASVHPDAQTPLSSRKSTGASVNKCHICWKEFRTTSVLNTHLLIHRHNRLHTCGICQRVFKQHELSSHMLTHQKKTYLCTYSGCHKTYNDQNTLKHHCILRHGVHNRSPFFEHPDLQQKPVDSHASSKRQSSFRDLRDLLLSKRKQVLPHMPKGSRKEDTYPSQVKPLKRHNESWTLATASKSYEVQERTEMQSYTDWAPSVHHNVEEILVVSQKDETSPLNAHGLDTSLDFPEHFSQEMLSFQPSKVAATSSVSYPMRTSAVSGDIYSKKPCSVLLKKSVKPQNKLKRRSLSTKSNHSACPEPKSDFGSDLPDPVIPTPPPAHLPKSQKRKHSFQDSEKVLWDTPAPSPPVAEPSNKRSRTRSSCLVSPSQVAMASFSTSPGNQFFTQESLMKPTGQEQNFCNRTYTRRPPVRRARSQPSCSQGSACSWGTQEEHTTQPCSSTLDKGQKVASGHKRMTRGKKLSPLIIPVSVPVSPAKALESTHPGERSQTHKGLSRRSSRLDPLTISSPFPSRLSSPKSTSDEETHDLPRSCATGRYPRQLRVPTSLIDHRVNPRFHPPPYTPPPMLSPHRPGTGLYFNNLFQHQQYPASSSCNRPTHDNVSPTTDKTIKPRINVGSRFQAEIPPLRDTMYLLYEEHPAQLVWAPWKDLTTNRRTQKKVTNLLDMCCSSVLTGGGTNIELALHCLHEVEGNVEAALHLLLIREDFWTFGHPLNDYHYTGSDHWTAQEMRLFRKTLEDHGKDFEKIHYVLQTKSVAQCVEYYYCMKKLKKFKQCLEDSHENDSGETPVSQVFQERQPGRKKKNIRKRNARRSYVK